jgi:hypothetical protein
MRLGFGVKVLEERKAAREMQRRTILLIWALGLVLGAASGFSVARAIPEHSPGRYAPIGSGYNLALDTTSGRLCAIDEPDQLPVTADLPVCGR